MSPESEREGHHSNEGPNSIIERSTEQPKKLESNETPGTTKGFEELSKEFEKNKKLKELLDTAGDYIDLRLSEKFSPKEKDNIKLIMLDEIRRKLNLGKLTESFIASFLEPIGKAILNLKTDASIGDKLKDSGEEIKQASKNFKEMFASLGLSGRFEVIEAKIDSLNEAKEAKQTKSFDKLKDVLSTLHPEHEDQRTELEIYNDIKQNALEFSKKINSMTESGDKFKETFNGLPEGLRGGLREVFKWLASTFPFLKKIFSMFIGDEVLDESFDKRITATNRLKSFLRNEDCPFKDSINTEDKEVKEKLDELSYEDLKDFFDILDSEKIDYKQENFWQELFAGNSKNEKINELSTFLKGSDNKILDGNEGLDDLIKKLNGLKPKLEQKRAEEKKQKLDEAKQKQQEAEKAKQELERLRAEQQVHNLALTSIESSADSRQEEQKAEHKRMLEETEARIAELEQTVQKGKEAEKVVESLSLEASILDIKKLPAQIEYNGDKLNLNIVNNQIVLGDKKYNLSIKTKLGNKFESIRFEDGVFILNGEHKIAKSQVVDLIKSLLEKDGYSFKGTKEVLFSSISYEVKIEKVV